MEFIRNVKEMERVLNERDIEAKKEQEKKRKPEKEKKNEQIERIKY